jgi:hypothetical protein
MEGIVAYFKVLHQQLPSATEYSHKKIVQDIQSPGWQTRIL